MATDSERPIEKLLRESAQQRREAAGAPLELHPATRRLLHGEVSRQHAKAMSTRASLFQTLLQAGPRLVWGITALAVLVILGTMVLPLWTGHQAETLLAQNDNPPTPTSKDELAAAPSVNPVAAPTRTPAELAEPNELAIEINKLSEAPRITESAARSAEDNQSKPRDEASIASRTDAASFSQRYGLAPAAAPIPGTSLAGSPAPAVSGSGKDSTRQPSAAGGSAVDEKTKLALANSPSDATRDRLAQRFVQTAPTQTATLQARREVAPDSVVLKSFQIEQSGSSIRILDADGSVYTGSVQVAANAALQRSLALKAAAPTAPQIAAGRNSAQTVTDAGIGNSQTSSQYAFRVSGTNLTLRQRVVFDGNLWPTTNGSPQSALGSVIGGSNATPPLNQVGATQSSSAGTRVSGRASVGDKLVIEVDALPAK